MLKTGRIWTGKSQSGYQQNKLWLNNSSGIFEDVSNKVKPYITYDSRSVAMADLWNRGVLDVIVANQNNIPLIYKNIQQNNNHWIDFDLHGTISNADAIGAKVELYWDNKKASTGGNRRNWIFGPKPAPAAFRHWQEYRG